LLLLLLAHPADAVAQQRVAKVIGVAGPGALNVRSQPGVLGKKLAALRNGDAVSLGTCVHVTNDDGSAAEWCEAVVGARTGWAPAMAFRQTPGTDRFETFGFSDETGVSVRKEPDPGAVELFILPLGVRDLGVSSCLEVLDARWCKIDAPEVRGWINSRFTTAAVAQIPVETETSSSVARIPSPGPGADKTTYRVVGVLENDDLNMRSRPSPDADVVGTIPYNADGIEIITCVDVATADQPTQQWCEVRFINDRGWVNSRFLQAEKLASVPANDASPQRGEDAAVLDKPSSQVTDSPEPPPEPSENESTATKNIINAIAAVIAAALLLLMVLVPVWLIRALWRAVTGRAGGPRVNAHSSWALVERNYPQLSWDNFVRFLAEHHSLSESQIRASLSVQKASDAFYPFLIQAGMTKCQYAARIKEYGSPQGAQPQFVSNTAEIPVSVSLCVLRGPDEELPDAAGPRATKKHSYDANIGKTPLPLGDAAYNRPRFTKRMMSEVRSAIHALFTGVHVVSLSISNVYWTPGAQEAFALHLIRIAYTLDKEKRVCFAGFDEPALFTGTSTDADAWRHLYRSFGRALVFGIIITLAIFIIARIVLL
jgi:uncharacterized protein YraI